MDPVLMIKLQTAALLVVVSLMLISPMMFDAAYAHPVICHLTGCLVGGVPVPSLYNNAIPIIVSTTLAWLSFGIWTGFIARRLRVP